MSVTKNTISALLVLGVAVAANANSVGRSSNGSSTISTGISKALSNISVSTFKSVEGSFVRSAASVADGSRAMSTGSTYIVENPSAASRAGSASTSNASKWLLTTSGRVIHATVQGSVVFIKDPVGASSNALHASGRSVKVVIDGSGRVLSASGGVLKDLFEEPVDLVLDGSGEIYEVSAGSVVASVNGSKTVLTYVGDVASGAVEFSTVASADFSRAVVASGRASTSVFSADTKDNGDQFQR